MNWLHSAYWLHIWYCFLIEIWFWSDLDPLSLLWVKHLVHISNFKNVQSLPRWCHALIFIEILLVLDDPVENFARMRFYLTIWTFWAVASHHFLFLSTLYQKEISNQSCKTVVYNKSSSELFLFLLAQKCNFKKLKVYETK